MDYAITLEQHPALALAVVRRCAPPAELSRVIPAACGLVWEALRAYQVHGAGRHVAVYLDDQINLEVGVELTAPFTGAGEVIPSATPAGLVATTTHFGPYPGLALAHAALCAWCEQHGHRRAGPRWEVYGHWDAAWNDSPSLIRTDLYHLLAPT